MPTKEEIYDDQKQANPNDTFGGITGQINPAEEAEMERSATKGAADNIAQREGIGGDGGGSKDGDDKGSAKGGVGEGAASGLAAGAGGLAGGAKAIAGASSPLGRAQKILSALKPDNKKKKAGWGGAIASIVIVIGGIFGAPALGPLQWVHLAQNLQAFNFTDQEQLSNSRAGKTLRYLYYKHDASKTKLGILANRNADKIAARMKSNGFTMTFDKLTGNFLRVTFDPSVPTEGDYAGLKDEKQAVVKQRLSTDFGVDLKNVSFTHGAYDMEASNFKPISNAKMIKAVTGAALNVGKLKTALAVRTNIRKGISFNPQTILEAALKQKLADSIRKWQSNRSKQLTGQNKPVDVVAQGSKDPKGNQDPNAKAAADGGNKLATDAKAGKLPSADKIAGGAVGGGSVALAGVGFLCIAKGLADNASAANKANVVNVGMQIAAETLSVASKIQDGNNVDLNAIGEYSKSLYSKTNGNATDSNIIRSEFNDTNRGVTLPADLNPNTQNTLGTQIFAAIPGLVPVCKVANNSIVSIVAAAAGGINGLVFAAAFSTHQGQELFAKIQALFVSKVPDLSQPQYAGGVYGEMAALGTRVLANETSFSSGGRPLTDAEAVAVNTQVNVGQREINSKLSLKDRYLNPYISTSLASHVIDGIRPGSFTRTVGSMISGLANTIPQTIFSTVFPGVHAAGVSTSVYYGIPKVGFTAAEDNNDQNPIKNADEAAAILQDPQQGQAYQDLLQQCNNVTVTFDGGAMDFVPGSGVTSDYASLPAACKSDTDREFVIVRNAVYDTLNFKADACLNYDDQQSCTDIGGSTASATVGGSGISPQGWVWPIHKEDLANKSEGLTQCWLHFHSQPGKSGYHAAIDIGITNKTVYAAHDGTVADIKNDGYNTFIIDAGDNPANPGQHLYAVYEHMKSFTVGVGDPVTANQPIGTSGDIGAPGSPHLHFGISDSKSQFGTYAFPWDTANPLDFLPADYDPALSKNGSVSCKTADIQSLSGYGFAQYKTKGTFGAYK